MRARVATSWSRRMGGRLLARSRLPKRIAKNPPGPDSALKCEACCALQPPTARSVLHRSQQRAAALHQMAHSAGDLRGGAPCLIALVGKMVFQMHLLLRCERVVSAFVIERGVILRRGLRVHRGAPGRAEYGRKQKRDRYPTRRMRFSISIALHRISSRDERNSVTSPLDRPHQEAGPLSQRAEPARDLGGGAPRGIALIG